MKHLWMAMLALLGCATMEAQEIGININYQLIKANEWDRATQVYNFSRPFLENKQPLLKHGLSIGFYYLQNPENKWSWGPSISFALHRSMAENPNFNIGIHSLLMDLGAKIQYRPNVEEESNWRLSLTPSLTGIMLSRRLNGEIVVIGASEEDQALRTFGFGFGLNGQVAYDFALKEDWIISPMIGVNYHPYVWAQRGEVVFNESATGDLKSNTSILGLQGGLVLRKRTNQ